ncbi:MAG: transketolase [Muribaculaceae bacterium]|nr:transketolase [Muribaculaceae bacterium]
MKRAADNIRILAAAMVEKAKSGHPGGSMGGADFIDVLYSRFLVNDPDNLSWFCRDRMFLDPGHMSPMLYGVLALQGVFSMDELKEFRQWGSPTTGHPELDTARGIENTSGPLGQGHVMAVGCAIAERFMAARFGEWLRHKTYAFISDGGIQEEISQGAGRIAGFLGLSNLIMFYDSNRVQLSTMVDAVDTEDVAMKYTAWGWRVYTVAGNDADALADVLQKAIDEKEKPVLIIGNTTMGVGCLTAEGKSFEGQVSTHGQPLSKAGVDVAATIRNLGGDPENPWQIFPEVAAEYAARKEELRKIVAERRREQQEWEKANPALAKELADMLAHRLPEIDWRAIPHKDEIPTRQASSDVLGCLAEKCNNMIVASADLANSDKTDGFLKKTHALAHGDFSGAFLHAGVAELTMAALMNGIVLHEGMMAACGTFFVFSDYMKPAIRMAALMELPVKYVWSHDSFRVGEDGPTHQPIEQEHQIRLLEELRNLSGKPSMLVLRPADTAETTIAWRMAMENFSTPTGLILTRQNVTDLPSASGDRFADAEQMVHGGYVVMENKDAAVTLVGNGSEVSLLCQVAVLLDAEGIAARVVSMPSQNLFLNQSADYRQKVIPSNIPVIGVTAGLPSTLRSVVGSAPVFGLDHFGSSAPAGVLDQKFGFTPDNILDFVKSHLS